MKKWLCLFLTFCLLLTMIPAFAAGSISLQLSACRVNSTLDVYWDSYPGAAYYHYSARNTTTGASLCDHVSTTGLYFEIGKSKILAGNSYRVWVGAYDADGNLIAQGQRETTASCAHKNTDQKQDGPTVYKQYSSSKHKYTIYYNIVCHDCGAVVDTDKRESTQQHNYDGNTCINCGYQKEAEETFSVSVSAGSGSAYVGDYISASASVRGSGSYSYAWEVARNGSVVNSMGYGRDSSYGYRADSEGSWTFKVTVRDNSTDETHSAKTSAINVTKQSTPVPVTAAPVTPVPVTAVPAVCRHTSTRRVRDNSLPSYTRSKNENEHVLEYFYDEFCNDCGVQTSSDELARETVSHNMVNGTCSECGYSRVCQHVKTYESIRGQEGRATSISDTQHRIVYLVDVICNSCRKTIDTIRRPENRNHSFDSNGDCTECDYRNSCKHTETRIELIDSGYSQVDASKHNHWTRTRRICTNPNCRKVIDDMIVTNNKEDHSFNGNTCTACGYTRNEALSISVSRGQSSATVGDQLSATASVAGGSGSYFVGWEVLYNGIVVYSADNIGMYYTYVANRAGNWSFRATVTDRKTNETKHAESGMINVNAAACSHSRKEDRVENRVLRSISDARHNVIVSYATTCLDCGNVLNRFDKTTTEDHNHINGVCGCGHVANQGATGGCTHPEATLRTEILSRTVQHGNVQTNYHMVKVTSRVVCSNCNALIEAEIVRTETEPHTMQNNICTVCGYSIPTESCDHADRKVTLTSQLTYQDMSDTSHWTIGTYQEKCALCGVVLRSSYEAQKLETHKYNGSGTCLCGHKQPVHTHSFSYSVGTPTYVNESLEVHTENTPILNTCTVCGYAETIMDSKTVPHTYTTRGRVEIQHNPEGHKTFNRCACGAVEYTGYTTVSNCCQCGNHVWGAAHYQNGSWQHACTRCGVSEAVSGPDEGHQHSFSENVRSSAVHPHQVYGDCICGESTPFMDVYATHLDCCDCGNHSWTDPFIFGRVWNQVCSRCGEKKTYSTPGSIAQTGYIDLASLLNVHAERYQQLSDDDRIASSAWRAIAAQATDHMTDRGFINVTGVFDAWANPTGTLAGNNIIFLSGEDYEQQKQELWKEILIQVLSSSDDMTNDWAALRSPLTELDSVQGIYDILVEYAEEGNKLQGVLDDYSFITDTGNVISYLTIDLKGKIARQEVMDKLNRFEKAYSEMSSEYDKNLTALACIIRDAEAMGDSTLAAAAVDILENVNDHYLSWLKQSMGMFDPYHEWQRDNQIDVEGSIAYLESVSIDAVDAWLAGANPGILVMTTFSKIAQLIMTSDEEYIEGEKLMAYSDMASSMNLLDATAKDSSTDYLYRVWAQLQINGCNQAQTYLSQAGDTRALHNLDSNELMWTYKILYEDKQFYEAFANSLSH